MAIAPDLPRSCKCSCGKCLTGDHCNILDNDCQGADEQELWEDEIRAAAGLFDSNSMFPETLGPAVDEEQGEDTQE
jgi:hypothetical protein